MGAIDDIRQAGQHIWLDDISRSMLDSGELDDLHQRSGVTGITANPTIFDEAIREGDAYHPAIADHGVTARVNPEKVFWDLASDDLRRAADLFRIDYDRSAGRDGLVSLELSPELASDRSGSVALAHELLSAIDRPNLMLKVPGTPTGSAIIEDLTAAGINVNVTLLFGVDQWRAAHDAYLRGLETRLERGERLDVSSVASFFLSRIDAKANDQLPEALHNTLALASAGLAREAADAAWASERWQRLAEQGARPQQLLWASTSTKDPDLPETYYVERLVGPDTIITVPLSTLDATVALDAIGQPPLNAAGASGAHEVAARAEEHGVALLELADQLQEEGVDKFVDSFRSLLDAIVETAEAMEAPGDSANPPVGTTTGGGQR